MNELIIIGKTVNTFGIKGELKVVSSFERREDAFVVGRKVLINNIEHVITGIRYHKNNILMSIDNLDNINLVIDFIGYNIYMAKEDLNLKENEFLYEDLIGYEVIDNDNESLGVIKEIEFGNPNDFIRVSSTKEFLIPIIDEYIDHADNKAKILYTKHAKDLKI